MLIFWGVEDFVKLFGNFRTLLKDKQHTVDGRNPKQPPVMYTNPVNNVIFMIFTISTGAGLLPSAVGY